MNQFCNTNHSENGKTRFLASIPQFIDTSFDNVFDCSLKDSANYMKIFILKFEIK